MENKKTRNVESLIDHSNDPDLNIMISDLEKKHAYPSPDQTYNEEEYLKKHDTLVGINVAKKSIADIFKDAFDGKPPHYTEGNGSGTYQMPGENVLEEIRIALLGDWGTYTNDSLKLAKKVSGLDPHYTIHLGDTYFTGSEDEIDQCYNPKYNSPNFNNWCYGKLGSFAMLGNHEMYSLATHYYKDLLNKWMGNWKDGNRASREPQQYSYFCLENEHWRIIALDTGTDSHYSFFDRVKSLWKKSADSLFSGNTKLDIKDDQLEWLKKEVFKNPDDKRGIILLTHHQPWDVLKDYVYPLPAKTLAASDLIGNEKHILWFCGHDHYFSMYGGSKGKDIVKAFVRCIGHAGMPVNLWDKKKGKKIGKADKDAIKQGNDYLAVYDLRERPNASTNPDIHLGYNGFAEITLNKNIATINYFQHDPTPNKIESIITETWTVENGNVTGTITKNPAGEELTIEGGDIGKAVTP